MDPPPMHAHPTRSLRRQIYDTTGSLEHSEELSGAACKDLYDYYKRSVVQVGCVSIMCVMHLFYLSIYGVCIFVVPHDKAFLYTHVAYTTYNTHLSQQVTPEAIDDFFDSYRGSDSERQDLFTLYTQHAGNMPRVCHCLCGGCGGVYLFCCCYFWLMLLVILWIHIQDMSFTYCLLHDMSYTKHTPVLHCILINTGV